MPLFTVTVPPTHEQGSTTLNAKSRADALWDYNHSRAREGLPPLSRMPAGTKYVSQFKPKTAKEYNVQGYYGHGWEDLCASDSYREARADLKAYRDNEPGSFRIVCRRVPAV